jgi:hypothetical protein
MSHILTHSLSHIDIEGQAAEMIKVCTHSLTSPAGTHLTNFETFSLTQIFTNNALVDGFTAFFVEAVDWSLVWGMNLAEFKRAV